MEAKYHIAIYLGIGVTIQQKALNRSEQDEDAIFREWNHFIRGMWQKSAYRALYITMQIVGEEQVPISLLCYVYPNLVYIE